MHKLYIYPVRQKAKEIISFLQDDERLREARKAAKITRDKYVGYSSEELQDKYSEFYNGEVHSKICKCKTMLGVMLVLLM